MESETQKNQTRPAQHRSLALGLTIGFGCAIAVTLALGIGYKIGGYKIGNDQNLINHGGLVEAIHASTAHGGTNMAVATGPISEDTEGIFFLDFLTGDLQCWVYYPRTGMFGAKFAANVSAQMPGGKNAEYLLVTGAALPSHGSNNARPANCLVYVVDVHSGTFAAYGVPWNESAEKSGHPQQGILLPVGGGQIRNPVPPQK